MLSLDVNLSRASVISEPAMPSLVDLDSQVRVTAGPNPTYRQPNEQSYIAPCEYGTDPSYLRVAVDHPMCGGCGLAIRDRFLLKVADEFWHENCLLCYYCGAPLAGRQSCYIRDRRVLCQQDYKTLYTLKCGRCCLPLSPSDMVYRCLSNAFHLDCFSCIYCGQNLRKGDQYLIVEGQIVCRQDYELFLCNSSMNSSYYDPETGESNRKTPKRPRTILNSSQRRAFKQSFELSAKPCRKVRETLAKETGLSVRVVQVWFQNQRAKMKKIQRKQELQKLHESRKPVSDQQDDENDKSLTKDTDDGKDSSVDSGSDDSDIELEKENGQSDSNDNESTSVPMPSSNPIDKLYSMQDSYFF